MQLLGIMEINDFIFMSCIFYYIYVCAFCVWVFTQTSVFLCGGQKLASVTLP